eukprot:Mycagemm_TRINITY_DN8108_c0_g1::TRINITY_DN8108_c0_g1_i1::g.24::m.24 type:complete len:117 gc:universal TRINITY_DN8108_c0_g1_i1:591-241(-)
MEEPSSFSVTSNSTFPRTEKYSGLFCMRTWSVLRRKAGQLPAILPPMFTPVSGSSYFLIPIHCVRSVPKSSATGFSTPTTTSAGTSVPGFATDFAMLTLTFLSGCWSRPGTGIQYP